MKGKGRAAPRGPALDLLIISVIICMMRLRLGKIHISRPQMEGGTQANAMDKAIWGKEKM